MNEKTIVVALRTINAPGGGEAKTGDVIEMPSQFVIESIRHGAVRIATQEDINAYRHSREAKPVTKKDEKKEAR